MTCYKVHKTTPCESAKEQIPVARPRREDPREPDEDDERLSEEQLRRLAYSEVVRRYLKYPEIRRLVRRIDGSDDPEKTLDTTRTNDATFEEFVRALVLTTRED
ncbi:hypothetical protein DFQ28_001514 [Apophysomyces sp. BC1034]|nr:hypothetical protein DFQ29_009341 [Apophysomyces sp. BC1021]KAG0190790.1 hypothetical protein DFQ28_001514 [Apophysomyces sp. BC1034]